MLTFIYFILILGITVLIHELGHFICAKKAGVYCYEFSIGMGPQIFKFYRKNDETMYSIRLFPSGGYVQMAGEEIEEDENIPKEKRLQSKTWGQKFAIMVAGVTMNFILAFVLLTIIGFIVGGSNNKVYINDLVQGYDAVNTTLEKGDHVLKVNGKSTKFVDTFLIEMQINSGKPITLTVETKTGDIKDVTIQPTEVEEKGEKVYKYGFSYETKKIDGILGGFEYGVTRFVGLMQQMGRVILYLVTGKLGFDNLAGPVGIYSIVGDAAENGFINIVYLLALISLNLGFVNFLPIPAFDGGRILFLIIEKVKGSPVNPRFENIVHSVGMIFLLGLMVVITFHDILRLFN